LTTWLTVATTVGLCILLLRRNLAPVRGRVLTDWAVGLPIVCLSVSSA
jgi:hypothetical protein